MKKKNEIRDNVKLKKVEDQTLLFIPDRGEFYKVNCAGGIILDAIKKGSSGDHIIKVMCKEFDVDANIAEKDLEGFLTELRKKGVLA